MNKVIHIGTCCTPVDADWPTGIIAWFGHVPTLLLIANFVVGFANNEIFFTITSNVFLLLMVNILDMASFVLKVPRPHGFDFEQCHAPPFAFPDPVFVVTMAYVISSLLAVALDRNLRRGAGRLAPTIVIVALFGYTMSTIVTHYFDLFLLVCNTVIAACLAAVHVSTYMMLARLYEKRASRKTRRIAHFIVDFLGKRALALQKDNEIFET